MPDIAMCKGTDCPKRDTCWRYRAKPSQRQSYFATPPIDLSTGECRHYWNTQKERK